MHLMPEAPSAAIPIHPQLHRPGSARTRAETPSEIGPPCTLDDAVQSRGGRRVPRPRSRHASAIATPPRPARALASPHPEDHLRSTGWRRRRRRRAGQPIVGPAQALCPGSNSTATSSPSRRRRPRRRSKPRTRSPGTCRPGADGPWTRRPRSAPWGDRRAGQPRQGCRPRPGLPLRPGAPAVQGRSS